MNVPSSDLVVVVVVVVVSFVVSFVVVVLTVVEEVVVVGVVHIKAAVAQRIHRLGFRFCLQEASLQRGTNK